MEMKQVVMLALQISVIATVFGFGLKATSEDLLYLLRRPALLARSLLAVLVIMPVVAIALVRMFDFGRAVEVALVALAISPVPPLLPRKEGKAGGHVSYGLGLMVTLGALSIAVIPLAVEVLERIFGRPFGMSSGAIAVVMLKMVLGPLAVGLAVRAVAPAMAARIAGPINTAAGLLMPLAVLPLLVVVLPALWGLIGDGTIVPIAIFVAIGIAVGHLLAGPDPGHAIVLALSTACRHPAIAMAVAAANYPEERFGGTIVLYVLVNVILSILYLGWQKRHVAATAPAA